MSCTKQIYYKVLEMFPDICPKYLKNVCESNDFLISNIIETVLNVNYPKREINIKEEPSASLEEKFCIVKELLPKADETFLRKKISVCNNENLEKFITQALEQEDYPTKESKLLNKKISSQVSLYTNKFDPKEFLKVIPNPKTYFLDKENCVIIDNFEKYYVESVFKNLFNNLFIRDIQNILCNNNYNVIKCWTLLLKMCRSEKFKLKYKRKIVTLPSPPKNIPLLQQLAYIQYYEKIQKCIKNQELEKIKEIDIHKKRGLMKKCNCCFDEEVLPKNIVTCNFKCEFCKNCVVRSVEIQFGEGKLNFNCLTECPSEFSLKTLQAILEPNLFSNIALKKQIAEVKAAGLEDLEACPFCDFVAIPVPEDKIFHCFNPHCMRDSCRLCKEPAHIPLRCEEIENDEEVKKRTYIENKMTEALMRKCYQCGLKFIKEDGCNKMKCPCGASMCYICNKPVDCYKHFNGPGGDRYDLCPLFSDTAELHRNDVLKGAAKAKLEIGVVSLKNDPTIDVLNNYNYEAKKAKK